MPEERDGRAVSCEGPLPALSTREGLTSWACPYQARQAHRSQASVGDAHRSTSCLNLVLVTSLSPSQRHCPSSSSLAISTSLCPRSIAFLSLGLLNFGEGQGTRWNRLENKMGAGTKDALRRRTRPKMKEARDGWTSQLAAATSSSSSRAPSLRAGVARLGQGLLERGEDRVNVATRGVDNGDLNRARGSAPSLEGMKEDSASSSRPCDPGREREHGAESAPEGEC